MTRRSCAASSKEKSNGSSAGEPPEELLDEPLAVGMPNGGEDDEDAANCLSLLPLLLRPRRGVEVEKWEE